MEEFQVRLPNGHIQKGLAFKKEGTSKNLIILTGMNEHSHRYQDIAEHLNTKGYDVYVLDAIGQGLNSPRVEDQEKWFVGAFDENVQAAYIKLDQLRRQRETAIMGHSMGSFMVQRYLQLYPGTASKVILMGSNGGNGFQMSLAYLMAKLTCTKKNWDEPDTFLTNAGLGGYSKAIKHRKTDVDWLSYNEENVQRYIADPYCGHMDSHGFWHEFLKGMNQLYKGKNLAKLSKNEHILIVSGAEDPVGGNGQGPKALEKMYKKHGIQDVTLILFPGMRHEIHNEKDHMKVYDAISDFLNK